jgi:hypothetical protein
MVCWLLCLFLHHITITPATRAIVLKDATTPSPYVGRIGCFIIAGIGEAAPGAAPTPQKCSPQRPPRTGRLRVMPDLTAPPRRGPPPSSPVTPIRCMHFVGAMNQILSKKPRAAKTVGRRWKVGGARAAMVRLGMAKGRGRASRSRGRGRPKKTQRPLGEPVRLC